ncbi:MAG: prolyl oligopeptidase family serine peptidase [Planctomycetes bacterium]|nr:prolyl oligopeptidase family serine peptidase [Planctomycetota bacterium]
MSEHIGHRTFSIEVPYEVILPDKLEDGRRYPLITALHGMAQDPAQMRRDLNPLMKRDCVWLFPRGPYPLEVRGRHALRIGYAWYMFDGDQQRLRASMEASCRHLLAVIDTVWNQHPVDLGRSALVGFSQGGYLAGVLGARNPTRFKAVASIAGRFKHEFFAEVAAKAGPRVALAQFHGAKDAAVKAEAARDALEACRKLGFKQAEYFEDPDAAHEISAHMLDKLGAWLDRVL